MANMQLKKHPMPTQDPKKRAKNFSEVALGYSEETAIAEAMRCLNCKNMPCVSGCPVNIDIPNFISKIKDGKFEDAYNNELANDLGNLVQRLATLASKNQITAPMTDDIEFPAEYRELMDTFQFSKAFDFAWEKVQAINRRIDEEKPWSLAKNGETEKLDNCLKTLIHDLLEANLMLSPFIPVAAEKIVAIFTDPIAPPEMPLFPKTK